MGGESSGARVTHCSVLLHRYHMADSRRKECRRGPVTKAGAYKHETELGPPHDQKVSKNVLVEGFHAP